MKILRYPNKLLETPCSPVIEFNHELKTLIENMKILMNTKRGVGLAANQVGVLKTLFLLKDSKDLIHSIVNPKIIQTEGKVILNEGCLSSPTIFLPIERASSLLLEYQNETGEEKRILLQGLEARIAQHEIEHLEGKSFYNKVNRSMRKEALSKLKKV